MLRALVQRLGDNISEGTNLDVALGDVGKPLGETPTHTRRGSVRARFVCRDREPRFVFAQEFVKQEGEKGLTKGPAAVRTEVEQEPLEMPSARRRTALESLEDRSVWSSKRLESMP